MAVASSMTIAPVMAGSTTAASDKAPVIEEPTEKWWEVEFTLGYDSKYMWRGLNFLGNKGIATGDLNFSAYGLNAGVWYAEGLDTHYHEVNFYGSYGHDFGPIALEAGYLYYYYPTDPKPNKTHEVYIAASTSVIPYITPSLAFYYDVDVYEGGYLELRFDGSFPVYKEIVSLEPWVSVAYDFDLITYGDNWNNFEVGLAVPFQITDYLSFRTYVAASFPVEELKKYEDNEVWGGASLTFTF